MRQFIFKSKQDHSIRTILGKKLDIISLNICDLFLDFYLFQVVALDP